MTTPPSKPTPSKITLGSIEDSKCGHRIVIYGPGGIGKTTLCAQLPNNAFWDGDESLRILKPQLIAAGIPIPRIIPGKDFRSVREATQSDIFAGIKNVTYDSATKLEEMAVAETLRTVKVGKVTATSIEDYGYGKGFGFVFDTFLPFLADCDKLIGKGINVILVAHDCTANVPNPQGEDWIRYEPRLQNPTSGKNSIRLRVKEWADHVLFLGYDVAVEDGKAQGSGTRTIYTSELPHCMAKSRTTQSQIPVDGRDVWGEILK